MYCRSLAVVRNRSQGPLAARVMGMATETAKAGPTAAAATGTQIGDTFQDLLSMCKRRGFVFPSAAVYGGFSNNYDFGPLGSQLKKNIQDSWWQDFVERRTECFGLDSAIVLHPKTWEASGHVSNFTDPLTECRACNHRCRVDKVLTAHFRKIGDTANSDKVSTMSLTDMAGHIEHVGCPNCGQKQLATPKTFNLLFRTSVGPVEGAGSIAYLRPETAQGVYVQFNNLVQSKRATLPFGVGQIGKAFRNEISPGNFLFRQREFDLMELQFFTAPEDSAKWHAYWVDYCYNWLLRHGISESRVRKVPYAKEELAHYAKATTDLQFLFEHGWDELWGIANRGDYDLKAHAAMSGIPLEYADPKAPANKFVPYVIEPAVGVGRLILMSLVNGFAVEPVEGQEPRVVLRLHERWAPYKAAVLPLMKKPEIMGIATKLHEQLTAAQGCIDFDTSASIGRRYRRQDEIGTGLCITVDVESTRDQAVTLRCRDTMKQIRISIAELLSAPVTHSRFKDRFAAAAAAAASSSTAEADKQP